MQEAVSFGFNGDVRRGISTLLKKFRTAENPKESISGRVPKIGSETSLCSFPQYRKAEGEGVRHR
jgi:hypothetical protein